MIHIPSLIPSLISDITKSCEPPGAENQSNTCLQATTSSSVPRSDSSTAMDVTFTPSTSPPKTLSTAKNVQPMESSCGQANNSSTSQKSQSPILTDFDSGIETMDIDNDPSSQTVNVNPAADQAQAAISVNNSHAKSSSPDKLENIEQPG